MRILVVGCGSIGKRHIRNLKAINAGEIIAFDVMPDRCAEVEKDYGIRAYHNLEEAIALKPDIAVICTPTSLHIPPAITAAKNGCHLFIEKPLSHTLDNIDELMDIVSRKGLITLVGCNMRFHPGILLLNELLQKNSIGKVICARVLAGQYLPDWHPWEDYRKGYSANRSLGGGVILDGIHEIDYISWLLGNVDEVFCFSGKFSSLEIDTEDMAEMLLKFSSGTIAEVHLDYIQRTYGRSCQIIGEQGTIMWDFTEKKVKLFSASDKEWHIFPEEPNYDINRMYMDEMEYFIRCVRTNEKTMNDIWEANSILKIALAAKESGKLVTLQR